MKLIKKLRSRRGESLTETLCAVLIAGLAVSLLAGMVGAASRMADKADAAAESLYGAVTAAEEQQDTAKATGTVTVTVGDSSKVTTVYVNYYGSADEVLAYKKMETGGGS